MVGASARAPMTPPGSGAQDADSLRSRGDFSRAPSPNHDRFTIRAATTSFAGRRVSSHHCPVKATIPTSIWARSEEYTSELQSRGHLVCRLLLEKKNKQNKSSPH